MYDYMIESCMAMLKLSPEEKLFCEKISALIQLGAIINEYAKKGYINTLLASIAKNKTSFILEAKSKGSQRDPGTSKDSI